MLRSTTQEQITPRIPESNFYRDFDDLLKLTPGKRYTFLVESTFGPGTHTIHMILHSLRACRFDKHENCVEVLFKPRGKQKICKILFYGSKSYAIWEGWLELEDRIHPGVLDALGFRRIPEKNAFTKPCPIHQVIRAVPLSPVCLRIKTGTTHSNSTESTMSLYQSH